MTPKKKAEELYMKFRLLQVSNSKVDDEAFNTESRAKKCALIAVDDIESIGNWVSIECAEKWGFGTECTEEFWHDVRDELNKL